MREATDRKMAGSKTAGRGAGRIASRVDWVDYAKGISILLVVMMHSTLGVEAAMGERGWLHAVVEFARPFRIPAFFLISGLFLARTIDAPWRRFIDRKVVHFAYFYVLWVTIQFTVKAPAFVADWGVAGTLAAYLKTFWQPFGTLWFIYMLPVFLVVTRLLKNVPVAAVLVGAAILEILPVASGSVIVDEFAARYVYFYAGYAFAAQVFGFEEKTRSRPGLALSGLATFALVNAFLVFSAAPQAFFALATAIGIDAGNVKWADLPALSLALGLSGAAAVVAASGMLARVAATWPLRWVGAHSIVIYLAFFLPMAVARIVLLKIGIVSDVGTVSLLVWTSAVAGPIVLYLAVKWTGYGRFLFERPAFARLEAPAGPVRAERMVPGE